MTQTEKDHYRRLLEAKRKELEASLGSREEIEVEQTPDELDGTVLAQQRDFAVGRLDRLALLLRDVVGALDRLDQGDYGVCSRCDGAIGAARLEAVPWAGYCRACQEVLEQGLGEEPETRVSARRASYAGDSLAA